MRHRHPKHTHATWHRAGHEGALGHFVRVRGRVGVRVGGRISTWHEAGHEGALGHFVGPHHVAGVSLPPKGEGGQLVGKGKGGRGGVRVRVRVRVGVGVGVGVGG